MLIGYVDALYNLKLFTHLENLVVESFERPFGFQRLFLFLSMMDHLCGKSQREKRPENGGTGIGDTKYLFNDPVYNIKYILPVVKRMMGRGS
jgi:hypothetical protein